MSDVFTTEAMNELYCVSKTIENGEHLITATPEIWVVDDVLFWPPGEVNRSVPTPPQADWIPYNCTVLKRSIGKTKTRDKKF